MKSNVVVIAIVFNFRKIIIKRII